MIELKQFFSRFNVHDFSSNYLQFDDFLFAQPLFYFLDLPLDETDGRLSADIMPRGLQDSLQERQRRR